METVVQSLANIVDGKVPAIPDIDIGYDADHGSIHHGPLQNGGGRDEDGALHRRIQHQPHEAGVRDRRERTPGRALSTASTPSWRRRSAGRSLGLAALEAAKKALDSHSPSREFIHLGENVGEGLAIGVNNSIVPAAQAASGMIDEVIAVSEKGVDGL